LAAQTTQENFDKGLIYPPFSNIRKISAHIAAKVAAKAYELGEFLSDIISSAYTKDACHFFFFF
jgi:malic enzyme